jgi:guanylate kinase
MQKLLDLMTQIWIDSNLPTFRFNRLTEKKWHFATQQEFLPWIEIYWANLVYALCERQTVNSVFEVPFAANNKAAIIWISKLECVFSECVDVDTSGVLKPRIAHPTMFALGGPSGVGKTAVIKKLKSETPQTVLTFPAYTTRPRRRDEIEGIDYYFRNDADYISARKDPRFGCFVEARGYWYWTSPIVLLQSVWRDSGKIYADVIQQRHEFEQRRRLFPELCWIWLSAQEEDLLDRLVGRGDEDVQSSIAFNRKLATQVIDDLVDLRIETKPGELDRVAEQIKTYYLNLKGA